jgi:beta-lactamase superfamily II metal-dependent hydrolase
MIKDKKILIILGMALTIILVQRLDFGLVTSQESGQVEGVTQKIDNNLKVVFFDVGQGDAAFVQTPGEKQILIDGGESQLVLEKLSQQMKFNDREIELVILTHPHADHLGGLIEVLKRYEVDTIWMTGIIHTSNVYLEFLNLIKEKKIPTKIIFSCREDKLGSCSDLIEIEPNLKFYILWKI